MKDVAEEYEARGVIVASFKANSAAADCRGGEIVTEAFYGDWRDARVFLKCGSVMEDMPVCTGVVVTRVVARDGGVQYGERGLGHGVRVHRVPSVIAGVR